MANGVLFVMQGNGDLVALQADSGTMLWQSYVAHGELGQTPVIVESVLRHLLASLVV
jgi:hypothetical protein